MSIAFRTPNPAHLLQAFNSGIDNHQNHRQGDRVDTWRYVIHEGHHYYTHTSANWGGKAWLRADFETGQLAFYIRPVQNVRLTRDVYAYYVGHLAETLIRHFPGLFTAIQTTPSAIGADAALPAAA